MQTTSLKETTERAQIRTTVKGDRNVVLAVFSAEPRAPGGADDERTRPTREEIETAFGRAQSALQSAGYDVDAIVVEMEFDAEPVGIDDELRLDVAAKLTKTVYGRRRRDSA